MADSDSSEVEDNGLFDEPEGFYQPEKQPTFETHKLLDGRELQLRLVGHNPLWGHHLWNAGRVFASYLESNPTTTHSKSVLELGAGAGLPSLLSSILGATSVLVTDYPDAELISNLHHNISHCALLAQPVSPTKIQAKGYLWGADVTPLLATLPGNEKGFDVLILADLLFNHSEHGKLLESIQKTLKREVRARALVFFTPYRPWLLERDLAFFDMAAEGGFEVEKIFERVMDRVMFEEDRGDELLRRTVFGYELRWKDL
ncbi:putative methyltransferase-domain-containing protein [Delphinella strobiligena]|nr:putative methyltransferase-domain-containing protein [Delphinella strobiligena]